VNTNVYPRPTEWLTGDELCKKLRISRRHLENLRKSGFPYLQLGSSVRYDLEEVEVYLRTNRRLIGNTSRTTEEA